jgi:alpha-D-xyloside xylohydrolase
MGQWYHPQENSKDVVVLGVLANFTAAGVGLAAVTLEPPWQTHAYPCTYVWNTATMFPDPAGFIQKANAAGAQVTLWEHG